MRRAADAEACAEVRAALLVTALKLIRDGEARLFFERKPLKRKGAWRRP